MAWINSSLCFVGKLSAKQVTAVYRVVAQLTVRRSHFEVASSHSQKDQSLPKASMPTTGTPQSAILKQANKHPNFKSAHLFTGSFIHLQVNRFAKCDTSCMIKDENTRPLTQKRAIQDVYEKHLQLQRYYHHHRKEARCNKKGCLSSLMGWISQK